MLLRAQWPLRLLPGWLVGALLLWALLELLVAAAVALSTPLSLQPAPGALL
jgi:hypothetical protein